MATQRKKAPCIDMRTDMNKDERVAALADSAGLVNAYEAIGRLFAIWSWCADRGLRDAPDDCEGYAVSEAVVRRFFGPRGVEAMLAEGCDELALGVRRNDGLIYLRGTSGRVAALRRLAALSSAGGKARAGAPRSSAGVFVSETTNDQPTRHPNSSSAPPERPAVDQQQPAIFLLPSSSGDLDLPDESSLDQASLSPEPDPPTVAGAEREGDPPPPESPPPEMPLPLPHSWYPDHEPDLDEEARSLGVDLEHELAKFRERAKNQERADWQAAWRKWLHHAIGWARKHPPRKAPQPAPSSADIARTRAAEQRERERIAENDRKAAAERDEVARIAREGLAALTQPAKATA